MRLSKAVEQTADAVFITDREGRIQYVNPAFELISGYPEGRRMWLNLKWKDGLDGTGNTVAAGPTSGCGGGSERRISCTNQIPSASTATPVSMNMTAVDERGIEKSLGM